MPSAASHSDPLTWICWHRARTCPRPASRAASARWTARASPRLTPRAPPRSCDSSIPFATRDTKGLWSKAQIVDTSSNDVGVYVSIAVDSTGKPAIAYFDNTNSDLKYAHFNGSTWDVQTRDSAKSVGQFPSLTFDP